MNANLECEIPRHHRPRCAACGAPLEPAPARRDGEFTYVGYYPCPAHPDAPTVFAGDAGAA